MDLPQPDGPRTTVTPVPGSTASRWATAGRVRPSYPTLTSAIVKVKPRELASSAAYTTIQTVKNLIPIALNAGWGKDYADPYAFVGALFDSR